MVTVTTPLGSYTIRHPEQFWARVEKTDGCWLWKGAQFNHGYGAYHISSHPFSAHRIAWRLIYGDIPKGMLVCHHCDVKLCVRPDHLFVGTAKDNSQDASAKGRLHGRPPSGKRPFNHPEVGYRSGPVELDL